MRPWSVSSIVPPSSSSSGAGALRSGAARRVFSSIRRMTAASSGTDGREITRWWGSTRRQEAGEQGQGHGLGPPADLVDRSGARGTAAGTRTALERLAAPRQELRQHLEDALGQPDATGLVVVEVDGGRELLGLQQPCAGRF